MVLWFKLSTLDRKVEGSNLTTNSYILNERPRRGEKERRARKTNDCRRMERARSKNETKRLDPKILSMNKRLDSNDVSELNDH